MNYEYYDTLLISEDTIKTDTTLDINIQGKNLVPAIVRAQDIQLQSCIGTKLYRKLQELIYNDEIANDEYVDYKYILDVYIQPLLEELVISQLCIEMAADIANAGVVQSLDGGHYMQTTSRERNAIKDQHIQFADHYKNMLEKYLLKYHSKFNELDENNCEDLYHHLNSAADCSIWLGGSRGTRKHLNRH